MQKTKIEWVKNPDGTQGYSWNPIKGLCPAECKLPNGKIYCYARKRYIRFNLDPTIRPAEGYSNVVVMPMYDRKQKIISRRVFVCSEFDLFHPSVKMKWRDWVFDSIKYNYHLTFLILTKFPQNIHRKMPDNVWLGITVTNNRDILARYPKLIEADAKTRFISYEPMLGWVNYIPHPPHYGPYAPDSMIDWMIIGRLTGHGKKYDPDRRYVDALVSKAGKLSIPIFMKDNLKEIWGKPLIQEMPHK